MIIGFKNKSLQSLFETGNEKTVGRNLGKRALLILDHLEAATSPADCTGVRDFHQLKGRRKGTFSMHVNGNWCITFKFVGEDVTDLNLEDYH